MLLKLVRLFTVLAIAFGTAASKSTDRDLENLRKHLGEIQAILDDKYDPCDNFPKFACGRFRNVSGEDYPNDRVYFSDIANDVQKFTDIKLEATQKAKDFIESCQKYQSPDNILTKVDVFKNPAEFNLARTLGVLKTSGINTILKTNINVLGSNKYRLVISLDDELFLSNVFNERQIQRNMELLAVPEPERADLQPKINAFIKKGQTILTSFNGTAAVGHDLNGIINFDWKEYLDQLKTLPNLKDADLEYTLEDVENLQKIINLAQDTDLQVLRLITALEFMAEVIDTGCDTAVDYFKLPIFAEFYRLYFKESDKAFNLDVLKEFERSHESIASKLDRVNGGVLTRVLEKRKIIENLDQILDPQRINAEFKDIRIEKENFYQNYLVLAKSKIYKYLSKDSSKNSLTTSEEYLLNLLNPVNRNKPVFYHFASQGLFLWEVFFRENTPKYSYEKVRDCLSAQSDTYKLYEFNDYDYFEYVEELTAIRQTYLDFKRHWDSEYDPSHKLDSVFKEFHLTSDQAFFLNLAQRECKRLDREKNLPFRIMLNLDEVSNAFSCQPDSQLNIKGKCADF